MIAEAVREAFRASAAPALSRGERIVVTISCPEGEEKAKKTFNPKLGIEGGLSILGTEGIVRPMSRRALIETIVTDVKFHLTARDCLLAVPGSYGLHFLEDHFGLGAADPVVMSNFVGETLDAAVQYGAKGVLLAGHLGKFVKLAGGIMNTHSREADCRLELLAIHAFRVGAPRAGRLQQLRLLSRSDRLQITGELVEDGGNRLRNERGGAGNGDEHACSDDTHERGHAQECHQQREQLGRSDSARVRVRHIPSLRGGVLIWRLATRENCLMGHA